MKSSRKSKKEVRKVYYLKMKDRYACEDCNVKKESPSELERHRRSKHSDTNIVKSLDMILFRCYLCDYEGKERKYLKTHIRRKHANTEYLCKKCDFITTASSYLLKHTKE